MSGRASATTLIYEPFSGGAYTAGTPITGLTDTGNGSQHDETWLRAGTAAALGSNQHQIATGTLTMPSGLRSAVGNMADLKLTDNKEMEKLNLPGTAGAASASYGANSTLYDSLLLNVPSTSGLTISHTNVNANHDLIVGQNNKCGKCGKHLTNGGGELVIRTGLPWRIRTTWEFAARPR